MVTRPAATAVASHQVVRGTGRPTGDSTLRPKAAYGWIGTGE
jgi:hypothetical protein